MNVEPIQLTIFDVMEPEVDVVEEVLLDGSGTVGGKIRIYNFWTTKPSLQSFANMLKAEYGIGGQYIAGLNEKHDGEGMAIIYKGITTILSWMDVAVKISALIESEIYMKRGKRI